MPRPATQSNPAPTKAVGRSASAGFSGVADARLLVLVTIALYWPATGYDFVNFDDPGYVTGNARVQRGLSWETLGGLLRVSCRSLASVDMGLAHAGLPMLRPAPRLGIT